MSDSGDRWRRAPVWAAVLGGIASLVFAPLWSGLLSGEIVQTCTLTPSSSPTPEADTSCIPDNLPFIGVSLMLSAIQLGVLVLLVFRAIKVSRGDRPSTTLLRVAVFSLVPVGIAALFGLGSDVTISGRFVLATCLCAVAAWAAIMAGVSRRPVVTWAGVGVCAALLLAATLLVFAVIPATLAAATALLAWAVSDRTPRVRS